MKNMKKLLLLVLSLVLLVGVFAVTAFAEDSTATVVYPDGKVQTVTVGEEFTPTAEFVNGFYDGEGNTRFMDDETAGWTFAIENGSALEGRFVPADAAGKKILASGALQVYYEVISGSTSTYNTNASTYKTDLVTQLKEFPVGATVRLWADMDILEGATKVQQIRCKTNNVATSSKMIMDLHGHELTVKTSTTSYAFQIVNGTFYLYSSLPGGKIDISSASKAFFVDSGEGTYNAGCMRIGELSAPTAGKGTYGKNLTVQCNRLNHTPWGSGIYIYGGTFVQNATSSTSSIVEISRGNFLSCVNATFVINKANGAAFYWLQGSSSSTLRNINSCTFISNASGAKLTIAGTSSTTKDAPLLTNCTFINVAPVAEMVGSRYPVYMQNCRFSLSSIPSGEFKGGSSAEPTAYYFAHAAGEYIEYGGAQYEITAKLVKPEECLTVTWTDGTVDYWTEGSVPTHAGLPDDAVEMGEHGIYYKLSDGVYAGTVVTAEDIGKSIKAPVSYAKAEPLAFAYSVNGGETVYVLLDTSIPEEERAAYYGEAFYTALNGVSNVTIDLYTDILLTKSLLFGTYKEYVKNDKVYDLINTSGNVDWDLNGKSVTVAKDVVPVTMLFESESSGLPVVKALHFVSGATFKLYSSVPGAKYINESTNPIFGVHKYETRRSTYMLGLGNDNLTVISAGAVVYAKETTDKNLSGYCVDVDGGTYIYSGTSSAFDLAAKCRIRNAKILTTAKSAAIRNHYWVAADLTLENTVIVALNSASTFIESSNSTTAPKATHKVNVKDCTFLGGTVKFDYTSTGSYLTYTVSGEFYGDAPSDLALYYKEAPEGKKLIYSTVCVNGTNYKVLGYRDANAAVITLQNNILHTTELWMPGSAFVALPSYGEAVVYDNGAYYFVENAERKVTANGVDVSANPYAASLAGQTVIVTLEGERTLLYFSLKENGVYTYYTEKIMTKGEAEAALKAKLKTLGTAGYTIKLYSDMTTAIEGEETVISLAGGSSSKQYYFDLNGFAWTFVTASSARHTLEFHAGDFYFYSSQPGAKIIATVSNSFLLTDTNSYVVIGEASEGEIRYGANLTVECRRLNFQGFYGGGLMILGGTFVQSSKTAVEYFSLLGSSNLHALKNATFIVNNASCIFSLSGTSIDGNIENCSFISDASVPLFGGTLPANFTKSFESCNFYNVKLCSAEGFVFTFDADCNFNYGSLTAEKNGYIAYTGESLVILIGGKEYTFTAKVFAEDAVGLVHWGYGLADEYWKLGATATHKNVVVDGVFSYAFLPVEVAEGENTTELKLAAIKPGVLKMSLTLQSHIGLNLILSEEAFENAAVTVGGKAMELGTAKDGFYRITYSVAPNVANGEIVIKIAIGENVHTVSCGIEVYAELLLEAEDESITKAAKYLAYAMVEYIRAMTGDEDFCSVNAPEGYRQQITLPIAYEKDEDNAYLTKLRFNLSDTIAIELEGEAGKEVVLLLASGRTESKTIGENGRVIFENLYVNEFYGDLCFIVEDEEIYTYSLANYLCAMKGEEEETVIIALNNYAFYADLYARSMDGENDPFASLEGRFLDLAEQERMRDGILALMYSENINPIKLLKDMYLVAFSESPTLAATPAEVLDGIFSRSETATDVKMRASVAATLYGGSAVDASLDELFRGARAIPERSDLIVGDILFVTIENQTVAYIYDGYYLVSVMNGCTQADLNAVLASLENAERYAVVRPSLTLATLRYALPDAPQVLSDAQIALVETAKAYLQRGYRQQYDDTRMKDGGEYRWQIGLYNPEDYTSQKWGYLNCAAFTYEAYRNALGYDLKSLYTTSDLESHYRNGGAIGASMYPYSLVPDPTVSDEEKAALQEQFMQTLEVGDLVVVRRNTGSGHVMLYIGNGVLIHSSGSNFDYSGDSETYEPTIRYMNVMGYFFNPDATNYIFREDKYVSRLCIVRPLDKYNGQIPENTQNRLENLEDILAEKLSSYPEGKTVNVGAPITFTFRIKNNGLTTKTLLVKDTVAANTSLLSAGDFVMEDGVLSRVITVMAGETVEISYSVTASGELGAKIHGTEATVGGVLHTCPPTYIENTLTESQQAAILAALDQYRTSNPDNLTNFALANAIYEAAGLNAPFADPSAVRSSLFVKGSNGWELSEESEYYSIVAPTLYGGRGYYTPQQYSATSKTCTDRSRLPREQAVVVGDIIVVKFSSSERVYMYAGDGVLVNLSEASIPNDSYHASVRLMRMMSAVHYYAILRPSMG